ncbi:MAG: hypothetical protein KJP10_02820 [Gammaproteobacteria bacterium]|nr:hypothetical protein [Gammaproteobacteria bacterium]
MKRDAKALVDLFNALDKDRQASLFDYAQFLQSRGGAVRQDIGQPVEVPKLENETVVGAIKRLKQTYPMIDSMEVFAEASNLMTDHMVSGRDAEEVINEIEALFESTYEKLLKEFE